MNLPQTMRSAACATSAERSTIAGDLPPSSRVTVARCSAAACITLRPTAVEPVKKMWSNGSLSSASAAGMPPVTTPTSSSGNASATMRAMTADVAGTFSDGRTMHTLPAAIAAASGLKRSWKG